MARFVLDLLLGLTGNASAIATPDRDFSRPFALFQQEKCLYCLAPAAQRARSLWRQPLAGAASIIRDGIDNLLGICFQSDFQGQQAIIPGKKLPL